MGGWGGGGGGGDRQSVRRTGCYFVMFVPKTHKPKKQRERQRQRESVCVCVRACVRACVCVFLGNMVLTSRALTVVRTAVYLTGYSDYLTSFCEQPSPPYTCHTGFKNI